MYTEIMNSKQGKSQQSSTILILKALIPYTNQNLKLAYNPSEFFNELERSSGLPRRTLIQSLARAKKQRLVTDEETPALTVKGRQQVQPFIARQLRGGGQLMVIFDIPQDFNEQRRQFRNLLKYLGFTQVQRSVWVSSDDHRRVVKGAIDELQINGCVAVYEASKIF